MTLLALYAALEALEYGSPEPTVTRLPAAVLRLFVWLLFTRWWFEWLIDWLAGEVEVVWR